MRKSRSAVEQPEALETPDSPEVPEVPEAPDALIDLLSAAVVSTATGVRGQSWFVGWTPDHLPAATARLADLSDAAKDDLRAYRNSGLPTRRVPYRALIPVTYVLTGSAIDFADLPQHRAEDQVAYTVLDATGARREIALGELAVLTAIANVRPAWQSLGGRASSQLAQGALPFYTIFAPVPGQPGETALTMLFDPPLPGASNEATFRAFVRHSIGRLLMLDESQPRQGRKGYMDVAGRLAGKPPTSGLLHTLLWLRQMGFVDFEDDWMRRLQSTSRKAQGGALRLLRALGMVEVDDGILEEISDHRPDYDVDQLELDRMIDLADQMARVAREALA